MNAGQEFQIRVPVHLDILKHEIPMLSRYSNQQRETVFRRRDERFEELSSHISITPSILTVADVTLDPNTGWEDEGDGKRAHKAFLNRDVDVNIGGYKIKYSEGTRITLVLDGENQGTAYFSFTTGHIVTPEGRNIHNTPYTQLQRRSRTRRTTRRGNRRCSRKTRKN
jgi:hypothetical protein